MKKYILLVFLSLLSKIGIAQAPVIDTTWLPQAGDVFYQYNILVPHNLNNLRANDTGANVTWDFDSSNSYWKNPAPNDSLDFVLPATRYISCSTPGANIANGDSTNYFCYIKNANGLYKADIKKYLGSIGFLIVNYEKPNIYLKSNFHFRQEYHDTGKYTFYYSANHLITD